MNQNILNCILIGVLLAIILIIIIKMFGSNGLSYQARESMKSLPSTTYDDTINPGYVSFDDDRATRMRKYMEAEQRTNVRVSEEQSRVSGEQARVSAEQERVYVSEEQTNDKRACSYDDISCDPSEYEDGNTRLIRDLIVGRKLQQPDKKSSFDNDDIKAYQSAFFDFDNAVNNTTRNNVDQIAEMITAKNNEEIGDKGKTIGEIYDGLTQSGIERIKQCKYPKCIIPPSDRDNITNRNYYLDSGNGEQPVFTDYQFRYETDNVNTGGKFYDDIEGYDGTNGDNLVWKA